MMCRSVAVLSVLLMLAVSSPGRADTLEVFKGDVMLRTASGEHPVTSSHDVGEALLSPDGAWIAYIRRPPAGESELWLGDRDGRQPRRLLASTAADDPKRNLTEFNTLAFAPDGDRLYVQTVAWATSNAIHEIHLPDGAERYIIDGNDVAVVTQGRDRGHLLVERHGYRKGGGSFEAVWLVTPDGKPLRQVAESMEEARRRWK